MPFRATFDCLWCGRPWTVREPDDLEGWAQLCPDCLGRAGDNEFLRTRLRRALAERGKAHAVAVEHGEGGGVAHGREPPATSPAAAPPEPSRDLVAYYQARAAEYDDWYLRRGRYGHGPADDMAWRMELDQATQWLDDLPFGGRIVELAAGTGWWSPLLAGKGELWCYDAAPAPLDLARERLVAHGLRAHLHVRDAWAPPEPPPAEGLFLGFWLSHVPRVRLDEFLALARAWLAPGGLLALIDSRRDRSSGAPDQPWDAATETATRRLADGRSFTIPKVYYEPVELETALDGRRVRGGRGGGDGPLLPARAGDGEVARPILAARCRCAATTIAIVGSGVMAEAMIAGLLRGAQVTPGADRRQPSRGPNGGRSSSTATASAPSSRTAEAVERRRRGRAGDQAADAHPRGARAGAARSTTASWSLSIIAGATTTALANALAPSPDRAQHAQHAGPAGARHDRLVRHARGHRSAARPGRHPAAAASARELAVDDEKLVAMATAVSGTGPTYVFLVMEALIDAAVHLGFPRHIAHDLVVETLEGSTLFAKASGMHPAAAAQHGHLARRHERRGPARARVGPPAHRPLGGRLGGLPTHRRAGAATRGRPRLDHGSLRPALADRRLARLALVFATAASWRPSPSGIS